MTTTTKHEHAVRPTAHGYFVDSATTEGVWYLVAVDRRTMTCSCMAGRQNAEAGNGRSCRHMRAMTAWQVAEDRKNARPSYPVNYAAFE